MHLFLIILGLSGLILLFLWKYIEDDYGHVIRQYTKKIVKNANTPEEYRRIAKKCLKEKKFMEAEEYYDKAKVMEQEPRNHKN